MFALWPKPLSDDEKEYFGLDDTADAVAQAKYDLVSLGRGLRRDCKIDPAKKIRFTVRPAGTLSPSDVEVLKLLLNAEALDVVDAAWTPDRGTPVAVNALGELFLPLAGLIDFEAERTRLTKELERVKIEVTKVQEKLANPAFAAKVPAKVLEEHQARLQDWQAKEAQIAASLANLPA
jgi:valyl-tRNA synthetase